MLIPSSTPYEQHLMYCYLANAASRLHYRRSAFVGYLAERLGLEIMQRLRDKTRPTLPLSPHLKDHKRQEALHLLMSRTRIMA